MLGEQAARHFTTAADLAEELSLRFGLDYRTAYRVVGRAVAAAVDRGETELTADLLSAAAEEITGGPAPDMADALAATRTPSRPWPPGTRRAARAPGGCGSTRTARAPAGGGGAAVERRPPGPHRRGRIGPGRGGAQPAGLGHVPGHLPAVAPAAHRVR